ENRELLVDDLLDGAPNLRVAQLGLRLTLELRLADLDREHAREPLAHVVTRERVRVLLEQVVLPRVIVERTRQRGLEAGQVRAAFVSVDVVDEGERVLVVTLVVLEGELDLRLLAGGFDVDRLREQRLA